MNRIWQKYYIRELLKVFSLFIGCFYFLYVLIDYSTHAKVFQYSQITSVDTIVYYLCQFTKRADILVPIALMISAIKVLSSATLRNEILVLTTGGISIKKIMLPFIIVAFLFMTFLYMNFEFLQPRSLEKISAFEERYFKEKSKDLSAKQVNALVLQDNTLLIYQHYDTSQEAFFDVFWLKNFDHIYRIQSLSPYAEIPYGRFVDKLVRAPNGEIVKENSYETLLFPEMHFETKTLFNAVHPPRMQSLTQLFRGLRLNKMSDREAEVATFFYFKLLTPLVCLLAVIGPAPYCVRFGRNLGVFLIYALSLFGFVTFFTFANAMVILGESQVLHPMLAILLPQALFFLVLGWKYAKL